MKPNLKLNPKVKTNKSEESETTTVGEVMLSGPIDVEYNDDIVIVYGDEYGYIFDRDSFAEAVEIEIEEEDDAGPRFYEVCEDLSATPRGRLAAEVFNRARAENEDHEIRFE